MTDINQPNQPQRADDLSQADYCPIEPGGSQAQAIGQSVSGTTNQVMEQGKQVAGQLVEEGKKMVSDMTSRGKTATGDLARQLQSKLYGLLAQEKDRVADRLESFGRTLHQMRESVQDEDKEQAQFLTSYADTAADSIERFGRDLHDWDVRQFAKRVESFAHRQPELLLGVSFLGGLLLARFLKTSWSSADTSETPDIQGRSGTRDYSVTDPAMDANVTESSTGEPDDAQI